VVPKKRMKNRNPKPPQRITSEFGIVKGKGAGAARSRRIDLGLAVAAAVRKPGAELDYQDLAAFCDCSDAAISFITQGALKKLRRALTLRADPQLQELLQNPFTK
jgi:hypothetical protein